MRRIGANLLILSLSGCRGAQSALAPAGEAAEHIATLYYWMVGSATVIWLLVIGLATFSIFSKKVYQRRVTGTLVIGGGAVFPTLILTGLLCYGLQMLPELNSPAPAGSLVIEVSGVRWWWRIRYLEQGREPVELANELVLPVNEPIEFKLNSEDVIHSFWIPSLGGKIDMFPGRRTRLKLLPLREGNYRGVCAEYCGTAHALMAFDVRVVSRAEFNQWLAGQYQSAREPLDDISRRGQHLFLSRGCSACHAIRGTRADGVVGPDLTHVGSRATIAASLLPNNVEQFHYWLVATSEIKPGAEMPQFDMLEPDEADALARYLRQLK